MEKTTMTVTIDAGLMSMFEQRCAEIGISIEEGFARITSAATLDMTFLLELLSDPFYSEVNVKKLREHSESVEAGIAALDRLVAESEYA